MINNALKTPLSSFLVRAEDCDDQTIITLRLIQDKNYQEWLAGQPKAVQNWLQTAGFEAKKGRFVMIPNKEGLCEDGLAIIGEADNLYALSSIPSKNNYVYQLHHQDCEDEILFQLCLGWALGGYDFQAYKTGTEEKQKGRLIVPDHLDIDRLRALADGVALTRDLINTPPNDMMPQDLEKAAQQLAEAHQAEWRVVVDDELIEQDYHAIYAVGRASIHRPRLIDFTWNPTGNANNPKITLVGKGVCFDSGGLNIKPDNSMALMKKDMGGAAHVLGLASMIMALNLPVRLRVLIGAVENAIGSDAYRPSDIIQTKKGLTVEITNTDAEGRLVLCDCLADACEENPDLLVDFATLTGAARVALGPDMPPVFSNDDFLAHTGVEAGRDVEDYLWHMPLWKDYNSYLDSKVADMINSANTGFAGSTTAGLFLQRFVGEDIPWIHIDCYGWKPHAKPGCPVGGEAQGVRAILALIEEKFIT